ncbi:SDR family oxidoreductase [Geothrix sp. 21YS21S-2]|uniref:SDR family oxidoreductase n=1 Tax=Geothrix sp. 21YS21S-2 TaxID=3068893 RepID=UPI0027B8A3D0|nr:SDR family oxidoreductase [Geothrix sp. 21YS21S-2]
MDLGLNGRIILITGGSKGIGLACASAFAAEGCRVAICSRSQANVDQALAGLPGAVGFVADCSDAEAAAALVEAVETRLGPVDVLVSSAGAARQSPPDDLTPAAWRAAMDGKYFSTINVVDPMVKRMAARGRGVILNVIGSGGRVASPVHLPGGAANAALMLATAGLGAAYAPRGVRVVGINPGMTETGRVATRLDADAKRLGISVEEARQRNVEKIPMGRLATPKEIAETLVFLASDRASYITGVTLTMDGARNPVVL